MPAVVSVGTAVPQYVIRQEETVEIVKNIFENSFTEIDRLLKVFDNGQIEKRNFVVSKEWLMQDHSLEEKNQRYIEESVDLGEKAVKACLHKSSFLKEKIDVEEIDGIFLVSSTGMATPTIDARLMNKLPFSPNTKRVPLWGLGCAGGGAGVSRAYEYCLAYPKAKVLVICIELCSLTFQREDTRKSNLVGTSLFADGAACALLVGDEAIKGENLIDRPVPFIHGTKSTLMKNSEDVMGWHVNDHGLQVIFSKDIPSIITKWLKPNVESFLSDYGLSLTEMEHFVAHPGGKKVLDAYEASLEIDERLTNPSRKVLREHGNMSSPTILYVLKEIMNSQPKNEDMGIMTALGPGFSSELIYLQWGEG